MIGAVLFDLDGTLLDIDMNEFIPQYFRQMIRWARQQRVGAKSLVQSVLASTEAMIANRDPSQTNQFVFENAFFADPAYDRKTLEPFFESFYQEAFDALQVHSKPFPDVPALLSNMFQRGFKVAIATNPVFPDLAVRKRLNWAGIGEYPFHWITAYENAHYTKPHLEYYLEISENLGVKPEQCLMVGNDVAEDMIAGQLGMKTFLVTERVINLRKLKLPLDGKGSHKDVLRFIEMLAD
ncbi:MAG: HAD family hydrolase [Solirubrobacterales bacterium]